MRLMVLSVMGLIAGLGLAAAIVSVPVMAEKGPLSTTLVADLGGGQEKVPGGGDPDGEGRAMVKVFKEQLCAKVETGALESSSSKATINLGMSGEKGPTVANLQERAATTPLTESTTPTTTTTTTGTTTPTTGTITTTTDTTGTTTGTSTPTTGTTTSTTGATGAQQTGTTTTTGDATLPQATTTAQSTTVGQSSLSQSTASPTASASASASASALAASALAASALAASPSTASTSRATIHKHTGGCVAVPRALSLELLEHPRRFYVNVTNEQYPEGAIRGQLHKSGAGEHRSGAGEHRSGDVHHRSGNDDD